MVGGCSMTVSRTANPASIRTETTEARAFTLESHRMGTYNNSHTSAGRVCLRRFSV